VDDKEVMLTARQVSENYIPVKPQTLALWRVAGRGPKYVKLGYRVFYRLSEVREWLDHQTRTSTRDQNEGATS